MFDLSISYTYITTFTRSFGYIRVILLSCMSSVRITITLQKELLETIEKDRGICPRSTYIADLLNRSKKETKET